MSEDKNKIFEISLSKIENSKSRKVCGKSNMLHRTLLVNSVINRVRNSERLLVKHEQQHDRGTPFMNYRESKLMVDIDDYDTENILTLTECQTRTTNQNNTNNEKRILSSLVTKLNSRSLHGKVGESFTKHINRIEELEGKENSLLNNVECNKNKDRRRSPNSPQKRRSTEVDEQCPKKKSRCLWPTNINSYGQDINFSIAGLASLFGDLVASTDAENSSLSLSGNFATAMVAY